VAVTNRFNIHDLHAAMFPCMAAFYWTMRETGRRLEA
jgi:hypothetical protein